MQRLSQAVWADLAPLKVVSKPVLQYLISQVAIQVTNTKQGIDQVTISRELESEGIEWSNKKIQKVIEALEKITTTFFKMHRSQKQKEDPAEEDDPSAVTLECLKKNSPFVKEPQMEAIVEALAAEVEDAEGQCEDIFKAMKLQQLLDFQVILEHEFSSAECKNVNITHATLVFTIGQADGSVQHKRVCVSLHELKVIRQELLRIEESLQ